MRTLVSAVAGLLLSIVPPPAVAAESPVFEGKPLSHWLAALKSDPGDPKRRTPDHAKAPLALAKIGDPAVAPVVALLAEPNTAIKRRALATLTIMGPAAKAAVPALLGVLKDPVADVRQEAAMALGRMGPAARAQSVPALVDALKDPDPEVRGAVALALGALKAPEAVPALRETLKGDTNPGVQRTCRQALARIQGKQAGKKTSPTAAPAPSPKPSAP